jgi:CRISPR-associated protein Cas1
MQLLNTLYVTLPDAFLRLDNDTLRVEVERESRLQVPLHHLTSVVCLGNVGFTTPLARMFHQSLPYGPGGASDRAIWAFLMA